MAPSATYPGAIVQLNMAKDGKEGAYGTEARRYLVDRSLNELPLEVKGSNGHYLHLSNGRNIFDASCGAAVACLGHGNVEITKAITDQLNINAYCNSMLFTVPVNGKLAQEIILGTDYLMSKVYICSSGKASCTPT
jgi:adenosylmethionine-8-amino-7-oxononanoate aminotransferase